MGFQALKRTIEELASEREAGARIVSNVRSSNNVVDFGLAKSERLAEAAVEAASRMRVTLIKGGIEIRTTLDEENYRGLGIEEVRNVLDLVEAYHATLQKSLLHDSEDGRSMSEIFEEMYEHCSRLTSNHLRALRRQGKRILEATERSDMQRLRTLALAETALPFVRARLRQAVEASANADMSDIFRASIARYPTITSALAQ